MAEVPLAYFTDPLKARFWGRISIASADECWIWTGKPGQNGYGQFAIPSASGLRPYPAHRVALAATNGPPTSWDLFALHSCDNRLCCNPSHLRWGTPHENVIDMIERNRQVRSEVHSATMRAKAARGSGHYIAKLDEAKVRAILADPRLCKEIAPDYGVSAGVISKIKRRLIWRHVEPLK